MDATCSRRSLHDTSLRVSVLDRKKSTVCSCSCLGSARGAEGALPSRSCLLGSKRLSIFTGLSRGRVNWLELLNGAAGRVRRKLAGSAGEGAFPTAAFSPRSVNKQTRVPIVARLALFTRRGTLSRADDVGSIKPLLRIAAPTLLWAFCDIYLRVLTPSLQRLLKQARGLVQPGFAYPQRQNLDSSRTVDVSEQCVR